MYYDAKTQWQKEKSMDLEQTYLQMSKDENSNLRNLTKISSIKEHLRNE